MKDPLLIHSRFPGTDSNIFRKIAIGKEVIDLLLSNISSYFFVNFFMLICKACHASQDCDFLFPFQVRKYVERPFHCIRKGMYRIVNQRDVVFQLHDIEPVPWLPYFTQTLFDFFRCKAEQVGDGNGQEGIVYVEFSMIGNGEGMRCTRQLKVKADPFHIVAHVLCLVIRRGMDADLLQHSCEFLCMQELRLFIVSIQE